MPPKKLKYQNVSGMMLARAFSVAIHCTRKRIENRSCARSPINSQTISVLGVTSHQWTRFAQCILLPPYDLAADGLALAPDASSAIGGSCVRLRSQLTPTRSYSPIRARPRLVYFDAPLSRGRSFTGS